MLTMGKFASIVVLPTSRNAAAAEKRQGFASEKLLLWKLLGIPPSQLKFCDLIGLMYHYWDSFKVNWSISYSQAISYSISHSKLFQSLKLLKSPIFYLVQTGPSMEHSSYHNTPLKGLFWLVIPHNLIFLVFPHLLQNNSSLFVSSRQSLRISHIFRNCYCTRIQIYCEFKSAENEKIIAKKIVLEKPQILHKSISNKKYCELPFSIHWSYDCTRKKWNINFLLVTRHQSLE